MEIEYFDRDDFEYNDAMVRVCGYGAVIINPMGLERLGLVCGDRVCIGYDKSKTGDFVICKSSSGWVLRIGSHGEGIFNSKRLAGHIIDCTWKLKGHVPGEERPLSVSFHVARLAVDEDKNKNVYALLRKNT